MWRRAVQMKASITEGYKRVAVHAEMIFGPLSMTLLKCQLITERYKRVAAYGKPEFQIGSSPPQAGFFFEVLQDQHTLGRSLKHHFCEGFRDFETPNHQNFRKIRKIPGFFSLRFFFFSRISRRLVLRIVYLILRNARP